MGMTEEASVAIRSDRACGRVLALLLLVRLRGPLAPGAARSAGWGRRVPGAGNARRRRPWRCEGGVRWVVLPRVLDVWWWWWW